MKEYHYIVAEHRFAVETDLEADLSQLLTQYAPFAVSVGGDPLFRLRVVSPENLSRPESLSEEFRQDDEGSQIMLARTPEGDSWLEFDLWGKASGWMRIPSASARAVLVLHDNPAYGLNNALMVLYALHTARLGTALFHAAVVGYQGKGYLFLGKSGTGKSTHARLWLENIPGTELINDDNPVVRVFDDGAARVYGSPWSGKTPCYRNVVFPAGGFVQLAQAPYNAIRRLRGIAAYAALVPSISGKRWDRALADGLHETENALVSTVPVWYLDCLPDAAAARLCQQIITDPEL